jgi:hypothetical protein
MSEIGGLANAMYATFMVISMLTSKQLFMNSILEKLFWIKKRDENQKDAKCEHTTLVLKNKESLETQSIYSVM